MYSEWHYKSLYLFGHPRGTWVFSKLQGLRIIFPKIVAAILKIVALRKWEFFDSPLHRISIPKILGLLLLRKIA